MPRHCHLAGIRFHLYRDAPILLRRIWPVVTGRRRNVKYVYRGVIGRTRIRRSLLRRNPFEFCSMDGEEKKRSGSRNRFFPSPSSSSSFFLFPILFPRRKDVARCNCSDATIDVESEEREWRVEASFRRLVAFRKFSPSFFAFN